MIFYISTFREQLIFHSSNYTHTYYLDILAYPTLYTLKRKKSYLIRATEWTCTLFKGLAILMWKQYGSCWFNYLAKGSYPVMNAFSGGSNHHSGHSSS